MKALTVALSALLALLAAAQVGAITLYTYPLIVLEATKNVSCAVLNTSSSSKTYRIQMFRGDGQKVGDTNVVSLGARQSDSVTLQVASTAAFCKFILEGTTAAPWRASICASEDNTNKLYACLPAN